MVEIWKDIKGFENCYQVSNLGNVRSLDRSLTDKNGKIRSYAGRLIIPHTDRDGYYRVNIMSNGRIWYRFRAIHRLVALTFIGDPLDDSFVVNHKDGNKQNNRVDNLEWVSQSENVKHALRLGLRPSGEDHRWHRLTEYQVSQIPHLKQMGYSLKKISQLFNISYGCIKNIAAGRKWKYLSNNLKD